MEENQKYFFAICTWPNWPFRAKFLSRFQFEGKTDVWVSQVRRDKGNLKMLRYAKFYLIETWKSYKLNANSPTFYFDFYWRAWKSNFLLLTVYTFWSFKLDWKKLVISDGMCHRFILNEEALVTSDQIITK